MSKNETNPKTVLITEKQKEKANAILKNAGYSDFGGSFSVYPSGEKILHCTFRKGCAVSISSKVIRNIQKALGADQVFVL